MAKSPIKKEVLGHKEIGALLGKRVQVQHAKDPHVVMTHSVRSKKLKSYTKQMHELA